MLTRLTIAMLSYCTRRRSSALTRQFLERMDREAQRQHRQLVTALTRDAA